MSAPLWYLAIFCIGAGASIPLFWAASGARRRVARLGEGRDDFGFHVAAEVATGLALLASGIAMAVRGDEGWVRPASAIGLGMLLYSLVESPGHYLARGERTLAAALAGTWLAAVPAVVIRLTNL